jgi:hypothetical protein
MLCGYSMQIGRGLALGSFCLSSLAAWHAQAQSAAPAAAPSGTETLETPYVEPLPPAPPVAPPPPPPASAPAPAAAPPAAAPRKTPPASAANEAPLPNEPLADPPADTRPQGPIRARRRLALTGELGWNGLAGFGPVLTYHFLPHFSADFGGGVSLFGWKAGARARYNFLTSPFTPFVGVGFNATSGLGVLTMNDASDPDYDASRSPVTIDVGPSYLVQYTVGFDFIHRRGFTMIGALGYAQLLNHTNVTVVDGELNDEDRTAVNVIWGSGVVISMGFGYAWE